MIRKSHPESWDGRERPGAWDLSGGQGRHFQEKRPRPPFILRKNAKFSKNAVCAKWSMHFLPQSSWIPQSSRMPRHLLHRGRPESRKNAWSAWSAWRIANKCLECSGEDVGSSNGLRARFVRGPTGLYARFVRGPSCGLSLKGL